VPERTLGMKWLSGGPTVLPDPVHTRQPGVNTRTLLWPVRWPAIAKQECIDEVEAAPSSEQSQTKFGLPCHACSLAAQCLNAKQKELGTLLYSRELLTNPRTGESSLFPRELMAPMLNPGLRFEKAYWRGEGSEHLAVVQAWDLAWSERTGGDYLVCMTALVDKIRGRKRLLQVERWQRLTFDQQCLLIEAKWRQYRAEVVCIESDAAQAIWAQHLSSTTAVPVLPHSAGGKRDLETGVPSLLIQFQNRKWEFPYDRAGWNHDEIENLLSEFEAFGWVEGKLQGVGEHDDAVMCFWHLDWAINTMILNAQPLERRVGNQQGASL
jgi:phage terminase large subunit-like protein